MGTSFAGGDVVFLRGAGAGVHDHRPGVLPQTVLRSQESRLKY